MIGNPIAAILLDWGGTLAHVATQNEAWMRGAQAVCDVVAHRGLAHPEAASRLLAIVQDAEHRAQSDPTHVEVNAYDLFERWTAACGWPCPDAAVREAAIQAFGDQWVGCLDVFPWTVETLTALRARGYRLGLASNCWTPWPFVQAELDRQGLTGLLDGITVSCVVGYRKPSPIFYEAAIRNVAANGALPPERVLFVGDTLIPDIAGPAAAGMKTALVQGQGTASISETSATASPDLKIATVADLLAHLPGVGAQR